MVLRVSRAMNRNGARLPPNGVPLFHQESIFIWRIFGSRMIVIGSY